ncbi:MAG: hypothetical protein O3A95_09815 [Planctomycetota bacterium]|nr:hypothetical protein [Planctomycetota bacterium]MDA1114578.1 hypothetical protein [Planctomycetota bacterium]
MSAIDHPAKGGQNYQLAWFDLVSHRPVATYDVEYSTEGVELTVLP